MKSFVLRLAIVILFLGLNVCAFAQQDFSRRFKAMRVPSGKIITIPLETNPATGFSWQLIKISDKMVLEFIKKEYIANSGKLVGSGGTENWIFKTLKNGKAIIVLEYRRPWEKNLPAQKREEFNVFVE